MGSLPNHPRIGAGRLPRAAGAGWVLWVVALVAAACGGSVREAAVPTTATPPSVPSTGSGATLSPVELTFRPKAGDCFDAGQSEIDELRRRRCAGPHDGEVFAVAEIERSTSSPFPGRAAVRRLASEACMPEFEGYVGTLPHRTLLDVSFYSPTETGWRAGDRQVVCVVKDPFGKALTESVRGTGGPPSEEYAMPLALQTGSCFNDPEPGRHEFLADQGVVALVPCAAEHEFEVTGVVVHPGGHGATFPGAVPLIEFAVPACAEVFETYVGTQMLGSGLVGRTVHPHRLHWTLGERETRCAIRAASFEPLVMSVRDSGGIGLDGFTDFSDLAEDDCLDFQDAKGLLARRTSCEEPHDVEVYALVPHPGAASWPGDDALFDFAVEPCLAAFEHYVGVSLGLSTLEAVPYTPSIDEWLLGDRTIECALAAPDGERPTVSLRGSHR